MQADSRVHSYGSDKAGLICGYLFQDGATVTPIGSVEAIEWLTAQEAARGHESTAETFDESHDAFAQREHLSFLWLHFDLSHARAEQWLRENAHLPEAFLEALYSGLRSTRLERTDQSLVAVINDLHFDFSFETSDISTLWVSVDQQLVVTARQHPLRSVDHLRQTAKEGQSLHSPISLLERLLRAQADVLVGVVRTVTARVDQVEDEMLSNRLNYKRAKLGALRRLLVRMQRLLAPEPASLLRLLQHPPSWIVETDLQELRAATEEFSVVLRDMSTLQERIKLLQEEIAAGINEANSRSLFLLTVFTVLALPINILAGLFGMNVGGVPLAQDPHGFWIVAGVVISFTLIAAITLRKRKDD
jgi:zinc transporter